MAKASGRVTFDEDMCKGCGLCVTVCPVDIIQLDTGKLNKKGYYPASVKDGDMEKCISCANCAMICPDVVITVERL